MSDHNGLERFRQVSAVLGYRNFWLGTGCSKNIVPAPIEIKAKSPFVHGVAISGRMLSTPAKDGARRLELHVLFRQASSARLVAARVDSLQIIAK
ncbi:hypothetical protein [Methylocaldum sp.]|uniref:hypothetical protein n=1 Tax=Methylocaldum sp. TaxID=1969727 RepID=UPI002D75DCB0|nr:hypothetical protein [Methylocaldum sp.]HYE37351.1 hypothetical protein [Methylocaldum sp.]